MTVFVDLDSTLCDTSHRLHLAEACLSADNWEEFSLECDKDDPFPDVIAASNLYAQAGFYIVILSARDEVAREKTVVWLKENGVQYDELLLRARGKDGYEGRIGDWKRDQIKKFLADNPSHVAVLMIDDFPDVRESLAEIGVPTLLVNPCQLTENDLPNPKEATSVTTSTPPPGLYL